MYPYMYIGRTTFAVRSTHKTTSEGDNTEKSETHNSVTAVLYVVDGQDAISPVPV